MGMAPIRVGVRRRSGQWASWRRTIGEGNGLALMAGRRRRSSWPERNGLAPRTALRDLTEIMAVLAFVVLIPPLVERFMVSAGLTLRRNLWVILIGHGVYNAAHAIHLSGFFGNRL